MEVDGENCALNSAAEPSATVVDDQLMDSAVPAPPPVIGPIAFSIPVFPPVVPSMAPLPVAALPPLAPLPVRPPVVRPLVAQNGEARESESESDGDESGSLRNARESSLEYEITEESRQVRERQEKVMQDFMMKRRAAALAVPTNDMSVRDRLQRLGQPMTLFGEREMERRDRLRMIMAKLDRLLKAHEDEEAAGSARKDDGEDETIQYPFYTEGSNKLLVARRDIAEFSILRSAQRLNRARSRMEDPDEDPDAEVNWALDQAKNYVLDSSEIGDDRLLSGCSFSRDGGLLATCSLSGIAKIWSMPDVTRRCELRVPTQRVPDDNDTPRGHTERVTDDIDTPRGHTERVTDVTFSPVNDIVATASADCTAKLWSEEGSLMHTFKGHLQRLARIAFHPSGKYLGTASYDKTWRLWDVESGAELLLQEGHSRSVCAVGFHPDGSLAASSGLDALARVWDIRTGRSILSLEGHVKNVLAVSFSPNGYHLATGSEDNTCRIWDLRNRKCIYIIPAHSNFVSQVKFEPQEGYYLVTASYDTTAKVWSSRDFKPIKTLSGHEDKVSSLDIMGDGQHVVTVSHDRTIKIWSQKQDPEKAMDLD